MTRTLFNPKTGSIREAPLSLVDGGTGANNSTDALNNLQAVSLSMLDVANGVAILGADSKVKPENIPTGIVTAPTVMGPLTSPVRASTTHIITNYDVLSSYSVQPVGGTAVLAKDTITYTAPSDAGNYGFYINGKLFGVTVTPTYINAPIITSPVYGAIDRPSTIDVTCTWFTGSGYFGTLKSTSWQLATDSGFEYIVSQVVDSEDYKLYWSLQDLKENTTYYVRCRQTESLYGLQTPWSVPTQFTTRACFAASLPTATITDSDWIAGAEPFQVHISATGDYAFVGDRGVSSKSGAVYVYYRTDETWAKVQKIVANDGAVNDYFGTWVSGSHSGDYLAIGAFGVDGQRGAVYVFVKSNSTWVQQAKLYGSGTVAGSWGGFQCDISDDGTVIAMGAHGTPNRQGAVYIFRRSGTTWSQDPVIAPADLVANDCFGTSVSLSQDGAWLMVGAIQDGGNDFANKALGGAVYFYYYDGANWTLSSSFNGLSIGAAKGGRMGDVGTTHIGYDGGVSLAGSWYGTGKVFVFSRDTSSPSNKHFLATVITDPDMTPDGGFGCSVSLTGDGHLIGGGQYFYIGSNAYDSNKGAAYVYQYKDGVATQQGRFTLFNGVSGVYYGSRVEVSYYGNTATVVASPAIAYNGAVTVYR